MEELYEYAIDLYKHAVMSLDQMRRNIKQTMKPGDDVQRNKYLALFYCNMAQCYLKTSQFTEAKEAAEKALNIEPKNLKANYRLAVACMQKPELQEKAYAALTVCFDTQGSSAELEQYKDWYYKRKTAKEGRRGKQDPWRRYQQLLESDELSTKQARRRGRLRQQGIVEEQKNPTGTEARNKTEKGQEDAENDISSDDGSSDNDVGPLWEDVIREEREERRTHFRELLKNSSASRVPVPTEAGAQVPVNASSPVPKEAAPPIPSQDVPSIAIGTAATHPDPARPEDMKATTSRLKEQAHPQESNQVPEQSANPTSTIQGESLSKNSVESIPGARSKATAYIGAEVQIGNSTEQRLVPIERRTVESEAQPAKPTT